MINDDDIKAVMQELGRRSGKVKNKPGRFNVIPKATHSARSSAGGIASAKARRARKMRTWEILPAKD